MDENSSLHVQREQKALDEKDARENAYTPDIQNEDGTVSDASAQREADRLYGESRIAPADREVRQDAAGTPQWMEDHSGEEWISDGGPTLHRKIEEESILDHVANKERVNNEEEPSARPDPNLEVVRDEDPAPVVEFNKDENAEENDHQE